MLSVYYLPPGVLQTHLTLQGGRLVGVGLALLLSSLGSWAHLGSRAQGSTRSSAPSPTCRAKGKAAGSHGVLWPVLAGMATGEDKGLYQGTLCGGEQAQALAGPPLSGLASPCLTLW